MNILIFSKSGKIYISTQPPVSSKLPQQEYECTVLNDTSADGEIGDVLIRCFANPDISAGTAGLDSILRASGAKSWTSFERGAKMISVRTVDCIRIVIYYQERAGTGFLAYDKSKDLLLPQDANATQIGMAVRTALALSGRRTD